MLIKIILKYKKEIIILSAVILISTIFNILSPFMLEKAIQYDTINDLLIKILIYFLFLLISYSFNILFVHIKKKYSIKIRTEENISLSEYVYNMDYSKILNLEPTYLINRVEEAVNNICNLILQSVTQIFTGILSLFILIILIGQYSNILMLIYILYSFFSYFGYKYLNRLLLKKSIILQDVVAENYKNVLVFMTNIDFLKLLSNFSFFERYLRIFWNKSADENAQVNFFAELLSLILECLLLIFQSSIYIYIFILYRNNEITFSNMAVIILLNNTYKSAMSIINNMNIGLRDVRASMNFVSTEMLNYLDTEGDVEIEEIQSLNVSLKNISYKDNVLIKDVKFEAEKGDIIGLVGDSGSGKSTLVKYLLGLYPNVESKVTYNGIEIERLNKACLKEHIMYISQNPSIFPITLRENLLLGTDNCNIENESRLKEVLSYVGFDKFKKLGLDSLVLENGLNLSGGDKQKIAIGRVLINRECDLLILDEFTNSLDSNMEKFILYKIRELYQSKIVILITHNNELLEICNKIYTIENMMLIKTK